MSVPEGASEEKALPTFYLSEQYLAEYFELVSAFRACSGQLLKGYPTSYVEKSKTFRNWLVSLVSLGEKLRRKLERKKGDKKKGDKNPYAELLLLLDTLSRGQALTYSEAVAATKRITDYLEDAGYTRLERQQITPENAVFEWE